MIKKLVKDLQKELTVAHRKAFTARWQKDLDKNKARLTYEKLQLIRNRKPTAEVEAKLKALESGKIEFPPLKKHHLRELLEAEEDINNLNNVVTYLKNQRVYNELLERYNPGLTMSQSDNVRKTANMVGLSVPEN
ncbi:putative ATP synthase assembly factor [Clavispora lusitaniae]|uniref:ATP synthase assembly factor n=3 Tax=Clavispora lusitaniae TaxID=36911 RepID=C4YAX1_CLAL4|nr:uncharacterized protein CLUG_05436 [Clavispora lusitaniae ATCC 42720]KAF7581198.1 Complex1_LYR-like family protein [Clavispora lusitaniae]EEQ41308.1 hypothetical protein CLUG_05436 [Clavispora lusitaniae ATCC 42720]OVF05460.1 hypothetical protein A9F13_23g00781 [Clavispora lusitaniae]QFZ30092.1 putative ATP synthase assembly factor [Clavispora lusitaniae]QFZ35756.1 putative ATP synthase assembly factor [Clavispora lusitaniae]